MGNEDSRDELGQFKKGHKGGPGRTPRATLYDKLSHKLAESISEDDIAALARSLIQRAQEGDVQAARLVLDYVARKPPAEVETKHDGTLDLRQLLAPKPLPDKL